MTPSASEFDLGGPFSASNVVLLPLFRRLVLTTTGTALQKSFLDLDVPRVRNVLPRCSAIFLVGLVENVPSTDFEMNVGFLSGFDRDHQPPSPIDIAASPITSVNVQGVRSADYNTTANFFPDTRLQLWWRNPSGITGVKSGQASGILGLVLRTA